MRGLFNFSLSFLYKSVLFIGFIIFIDSALLDPVQLNVETEDYNDIIYLKEISSLYYSALRNSKPTPLFKYMSLVSYLVNEHLESFPGHLSQTYLRPRKRVGESSSRAITLTELFSLLCLFSVSVTFEIYQ